MHQETCFQLHHIFCVCVCLCVRYFSVCVPYLWWLGSICVDLTEEIPRLIALSCLACINLLNRAKTLVQKYQLYQPMPSRIQKLHTTSQEHNKRTNIKGQAYCFYSKFKWECLSFVTSRQTSHCSSAARLRALCRRTKWGDERLIPYRVSRWPMRVMWSQRIQLGPLRSKYAIFLKEQLQAIM